MAKQVLTYAEAVNQAMHQAMEQDANVFCYGLGVDDPRRIFGTTAGLKEAYPERVFDMPTAENAMTGIGIGAALQGMRPVMVHQRLDFFLLAMDQLVNSAAKWHYMFNGQRPVPMVIRLILGRGWGQGPTHSQSLHAWFAHIPGLKVVMPTSPADAKGLLLASIFDDNPVVFLEHRWLHHQRGEVPEEADFRIPLGQAKVLQEGTDITLVALSYQCVEAMHAVKALQQQGVSAELIDLRTVNPIDWATVYTSVQKTGRLLALDTGAITCSVSAEVLARVTEHCFSALKCAPKRLAMPDVPEPTSYGLTRSFYFGAQEIAQTVWHMLHAEPNDFLQLARQGHHDVPGDWFTGPF
ncbi:alpha-ketoacid dehydrogenase subunit beta [Balneatrix alpica]|uniref:Alpha-ketoacid dehydrogenase subunit beta n=1 Tax=Balneatrix alpica TaxID=75684 RepID=A0ABV5ZEC3_9GAMM|nr:transketolase C-terminal domain-containing protein [Balneatrix alpica]